MQQAEAGSINVLQMKMMSDEADLQECIRQSSYTRWSMKCLGWAFWILPVLVLHQLLLLLLYCSRTREETCSQNQKQIWEPSSLGGRHKLITK